jgi:23S rRNA pseudouridine955/2504/2580 synthase
MPKPIRFEDLIVHEDEQLLLVNKPTDMASLDDKSKQNLQTLAQEYLPSLQLAHRLDKHTSGILLMAKDSDTYRSLALQFQHREVTKNYLALATGVHHFEALKVDLPLLITTNKKVSVHKQDGKRAETICQTEESFRHYTLVRCQPITGRMHQIRVHLGAIHAPIAGDSLYGGQDIMLSEIKRKYHFSSRREERPLNHSFLLHAQRLQFRHPASQEMVQFEAPLSDNFDTVLKVLRKWDQ